MARVLRLLAALLVAVALAIALLWFLQSRDKATVGDHGRLPGSRMMCSCA